MGNHAVDYVGMCEDLTALNEDLLKNNPDKAIRLLIQRFANMEPADLRTYCAEDVALMLGFATLGVAYLGRRRQELAILEKEHA